MPKCKSCSSRHQRAIDAAILAGTSLRAIGRKFGVSYDSVRRHSQHMQRALQAGAKDADELQYGRTLLEQLAGIKSDLARIQADCEQRRDPRAAIKALDSRIKALETEGKLSGAITTGSRSLTINVESSGDEIRDVREYLQISGVSEELIKAVIEQIETNNARRTPLTPKLIEGEVQNA